VKAAAVWRIDASLLGQDTMVVVDRIIHLILLQEQSHGAILRCSGLARGSVPHSHKSSFGPMAKLWPMPSAKRGPPGKGGNRIAPVGRSLHCVSPEL
jgi:hypothetical protein